MKTLIFIHGGESFTEESQYLDFLRNIYAQYYISPWEDREKNDYRTYISRKWIWEWWQVYYPVMPNKLNARYNEWKIVFEGVLSKLNSEDEVTFVGGSLGGCFLLKYFSEIHLFPYVINQIYLLAACISEWDFTAPTSYEYLQKLWNRVHIWHAEDDAVVPFSTAEELSRFLPEAQTHFFPHEKWYGHFHGVDRIVELEEVIFCW